MGLKCLIFVILAGSITQIRAENDNSAVTVEASNTTQQNNSSYRLPEEIYPSLYTLEIKTYFEPEFLFEGRVKIRINVINDTSDIILHSRGLNITESEVTVTQIDNEEKYEIINHDYQIENNFYIIKLAKNLIGGAVYDLFIPYKATLAPSLAGYYRSSYIDRKSNSTKWLAVTQFEPTDARRAFPCFDEPAMKAKFRVSLVRDKALTSISNMPLENSESLEGDWVRDNYAESVIMSTYLVAFVVSDFSRLESTPGRTKFRVWARPDAVAQASYSLDIGPKILDFFEKYFDVEYPLPKMDMIAIPDFNSGAMENWGLVTYRETAMLYEEGVSAASAKESVTRVVAHELAHQWFGNLVTMKWWDDLWLNEGFATYVAALGLAHVQPQWHSLDDQAMEAMLTVFSLDALQSSHPVSATIKHPSEISQIFDSISYSKGSFLLRMMSHYLGENTFRRGVTRYLRAHKFGNAAQDMLWACLEEQANLDEAKDAQEANAVTSGIKRGTVKQIMDSWTLQTGYPVVTIERNYKDRTAHASQSRFLTDWRGRSGAAASLWWVPISFTHPSDLAKSTKPRVWLHESNATISGLPDENDWLLLNVNSTALYRVNYDPENWRLISAALRDEKTRDMIPNLNRAQLIDDSLDLARAGQLEYSSALDVLRYLRHERNYLPWRAAFSNLIYFTRMTRRTAGFGAFRSLMKSLLAPVYTELGNKPFRVRSSEESLPMTKHRSQLLGWSCSMGVLDCENRAAALFKSWQNQKEDPDKVNPISVDFRGVVYCSAIKLGGQDAWDFLWKRYLAANVAAEKSRLLSALGCAKEIWLLHKYLDMSLDETSGIRKQDAVSVFYAVARSSSGFYVAREFLTTRIADIHAFFGPKASRLGRYIGSISESMNTEADLKQMQMFTEEHATYLKDAKLSVKQALENINLNVQWRSQYYKQVIDWLSEHANSKYFA